MYNNCFSLLKVQMVTPIYLNILKMNSLFKLFKYFISTRLL